MIAVFKEFCKVNISIIDFYVLLDEEHSNNFKKPFQVKVLYDIQGFLILPLLLTDYILFFIKP
jgi:hypothetical protein